MIRILVISLLFVCVLRCSAVSLLKPRSDNASTERTLIASNASQESEAISNAAHESHGRKHRSKAVAMQAFYSSAVFDWQTVAFDKGGPEAASEKASLLTTVAVPSIAIMFGMVLYSKEATSIVGKFTMFFGAQCFMNLYMKSVISETPVSVRQDMYGFPAPFIVTALQMVISFLCMCTVILATWVTPWAYRPKAIEKRDVPPILCLAVTFTANISLNNMSLTMIDISMNQVVRSGGPVAIIIVQFLMSVFLGKKMKTYQPMSYLFLLGTMVFAALTVLQKYAGNGGVGSSSLLIPGVLCCFCSILASASNMLVVSFLGTDCKLNPIDSILYMALPSAMLLILPAYFIPHKVPWGHTGLLTDTEIFSIVWSSCPSLVGLSCLSGVFAMVYNLFMYNIAQTMSAMAVEVASNFNKAATIALALGLGMEALPAHDPWKMITCIAGNILSVTCFGLSEKMAEMPEKNKENTEQTKLAK